MNILHAYETANRLPESSLLEKNYLAKISLKQSTFTTVQNILKWKHKFHCVQETYNVGKQISCNEEYLASLMYTCSPDMALQNKYPCGHY